MIKWYLFQVCKSGSTFANQCNPPYQILNQEIYGQIQKKDLIKSNTYSESKTKTNPTKTIAWQIR
jgi:hypothetical protein